MNSRIAQNTSNSQKTQILESLWILESLKTMKIGVYAIFYWKTQITLVLEGFRTNQMHHSNRVGEADSFGEKIQKVSIILNNANFLNFSPKKVRLSKPDRMVHLVCPETF